MKRALCLLMCALLVTALSPIAPRAAAAVDYSTVKVKLSIGTVTSVGVGVNGSYFILENGAPAPTSGIIATIVPGQAAITITDTSGNVLYTGAKATLIRMDAQSSGSGVLRMVNSQHGTRNYLGHMMFYYNNGAVMVVNEVPMQQYLYGVVGHEMSNTWPIEALKAQAVAARGYAVRMMTGATYDLVDTASDQVYKGYNAENNNVIRAVEETAWEVLYHNGQIVKTYYAASNGGQTDLAQNAWSEAYPYFAIVDDPYDLANPMSVRQDIVFPKDAVSTPMNPILEAYLKAKVGPYLQQQGYSVFTDQIRILGVQQLIGHTPKYAEPSRNWTQCRIVLLVAAQQAGQVFDPNTGQQIVTGVETQIPVQFDFPISELKDANLPYQLFKPDNSLRMFRVEEQGSHFVLSNVRYGHGVGMSQRGAQQMANSGMSYRDILSFYYVNTQLQKISGQTVVAPTPMPQVQQGGTATGVVTSSTLNMRSEPNTKAGIIVKLKRNAQLTVTGETNGWYACVYDGKTGYVSKDYVRIIAEQAAATAAPALTQPPQSTAPVMGTITADSVNVRQGAGTEYDRVGTLNKGTQVQVLSAFGDWFQIQAGALSGYVINSYIAVTDLGQIPSYGNSTGNVIGSAAPQPTIAAPTLDPNKIFGQVVTESAAILKKASKSSGKLKDVAKGYVIEIIAQNDTYYKIVEDGKNYWIEKSVLQLLSVGAVHPNPSQLNPGTDSAAPDAAAQATAAPAAAETSSKKGTASNLNSYTYIYTKANTKSTRVAKLTKNEAVTVTSEEGDFYYLKSDSSGKSGFVPKKYITFSNDKASDKSSASKATATPKPSSSKATATPKPNSSSKTVSVALESARVYDSVGSKTYKTLPKGTKLEVKGTSGAYYKVSYDGKTGYIMKEHVK